MLIGIDVDQVVADTASMWIHWLECMTGKKMPDSYYHSSPAHYDLTKYFQPTLTELGLDGLEFWRSTHLYDTCPVVKGAKEYISKLNEDGHDIVFISSIKGNHNKSKYLFLKRNFPYMEGYVATKEKYLIACDAFIDDRLEHVNSTGAQIPILFDTKFSQTRLQTNKEIYVAKGWLDVYNHIKRRSHELTEVRWIG